MQVNRLSYHEKGPSRRPALPPAARAAPRTGGEMLCASSALPHQRPPANSSAGGAAFGSSPTDRPVSGPPAQLGPRAPHHPPHSLAGRAPLCEPEGPHSPCRRGRGGEHRAQRAPYAESEASTSVSAVPRSAEACRVHATACGTTRPGRADRGVPRCRIAGAGARSRGIPRGPNPAGPSGRATTRPLSRRGAGPSGGPEPRGDLAAGGRAARERRAACRGGETRRKRLARGIAGRGAARESEGGPGRGAALPAVLPSSGRRGPGRAGSRI